MVSATVNASSALVIAEVGSVTIRRTLAGHTRVFCGRRSMTPVGPLNRRVSTSSARSSLDDTHTAGPGWTTAAGARMRRGLSVGGGALIDKSGGLPVH